MKAIRLSFVQMLSFIKQDMMLFVACFSPFICGFLFKIAVPRLEAALTARFSTAAIIAPYYSLFDLFFSVLSPTMFCFVTAMVILEENDDHIAGYLFVTPLGKRGYLITRLGIPAVLALVVTVILLPVFKLTAISHPVTLLLAVAGALQGLIIPMLVVSFSSNKLEGMALTKLSSLMMFGILAPFFIKANIQYLLSPLPSFWMAQAIRESNSFYFVISIIISCIWCGFLAKLFIHKTSK